jgi:hypothetical protein
MSMITQVTNITQMKKTIIVHITSQKLYVASM